MGIDNRPTRRSFLNYLLGGTLVAWAASILYPIFSYLKPPKIPEPTVSSVKLGKASELAADSSMIFKFGNKPGILVKTASGEIKAFEATCTHLDCTVQYRQDWGQIWCACHNGRYDINGRNVSGPPPRPLEPFKVVIQDDEIIVAKSES